MADTNDSRYKTGNPICDAVRFLCDASFAVLPRDAARQLGEFEKNLLGRRPLVRREEHRLDRRQPRRGRAAARGVAHPLHPPGPEPITSTPPPEGVGY
jgi:hypothetical protein